MNRYKEDFYSSMYEMMQARKEVHYVEIQARSNFLHLLFMRRSNRSINKFLTDKKIQRSKAL